MKRSRKTVEEMGVKPLKTENEGSLTNKFVNEKR